MPAPSWRMKPARTRSLWLATWASAGASLRVGTKAFESRTGRIGARFIPQPQGGVARLARCPGAGLALHWAPVNVATRRIFVYAVVPLALFALWAWKTGYLWPEPSLDPNPLAIARGEEVFKGRCLQCH